MWIVALLAGLIAYLVVGGPAFADMVSLGTVKDNTLYEDAQGDRSNGQGQYFFVGKTGPLTIELRRGLVQFDIAGNVPAGATIDSVRLRLHMNKTNSLGQNVSVRPVLADWGEGASDATGEEGTGGPAATGDATWLHRSFSSTTWASPGGEFSASNSATTNVTTPGFYDWGTTAQMRSDVQGWLDSPATNFGWAVLGNEAATGNAQRYTAKEDTIPANRPVLVVHYSMPGPCDCPFLSDINEDSFVDATDLAFVIDIVFFGASDVQDPDCPNSRADFNADGFADATDLAFLIDHVFFGGPGPTDPCL